MQNITITDIAREAGVSKATVSRVLNNHSIVEASTRERVQQVIDKYHFKPSVLARSMSTQKTSLIGLLVPEIDNPFFGNLIRGAMKVLESKGYTVVCYNSDEDPKRDIKAIRNMISNRFSGLLYTPVQDYCDIAERKEIQELLEEFHVPVVLMDRDYSQQLPYSVVAFDDTNAIREAVVKLSKAGHSRIGFLNASSKHLLGKLRAQGYRQGLAECHLEYDKIYDYVIRDYSSEEAYEKSMEMLQTDNRPTAVITGNNSITLGLIRALSECGMSIPKDMECIGLDRIEALDLIGYGLNYILRDSLKLGETAARVLLEHLENEAMERQSIILDHAIVMH